MSRHRLDETPTWRCPDEGRLAAYVDGGLTAERRASLERHLAECGYCLGQVSALAQLGDAALPEVDPALIRRAQRIPQGKIHSQRKPGWRWAAGSVAVACTAVLVALWVRPPHPAEKESVRTVSEHNAGLELLQPREGLALQRSNLDFRWSPVSRALFYEIRVLTADGDLLWEARTDGPEARPPATVSFPAGQNYFVSVTAWLPEGKAVKSTAVGFRILGT